jgi:hypothetical protein
MRITIEDATMADLGVHDGDDLDLLVAEALAEKLMQRIDAKEADRLLKNALSKAVGRAVSGALRDRIGDQPLTLLEAILAEAKAQITRGNSYQGVSTPLQHVVAAEVYRVLHDEVDGLINEARASIKQQMPQEIAKLVRASFSARR